MPFELAHEEVIVGGETLTVYEASNAMDIARSVMIAEAKQPEEGTANAHLYYMQALLYPSLVSCTKGNLPTLEEFMYNIPAKDTEKWTDVAKRLNSAWFRFVSEEEETPEKKEP